MRKLTDIRDMTSFTYNGNGNDRRMRPDLYRLRSLYVLAVLLLMGIVLLFAAPGKAYASDEGPSLQERHVWFEYGCTECDGTVRALSDNGIRCEDNSGTTYPQEYSVTMMLCDGDHVLKAVGDGVTDDKVTFESLTPSVTDIDSNGNLTLKKTGSARIRAQVAADDEYDECTVYLSVKVDKHSAWAGNEWWGYYVDRPHDWGLDLDTEDGPHQIKLLLRPGAKCVRFKSNDVNVAYVDQNGMVTPVSAGETTITIETDDGGGRYKKCVFGSSITVTGDCTLREQEITGDIGPFTIDWRNGLQLDLDAETELEYSILGGNCATVDQDGFVEFSQDGQITIGVIAVPNEEYRPATAEVVINGVESGMPEVRRVWFTYGCTECDGTMHPCSDEGIGHAGSGGAYPSYYSVNMMMCDTGHIVHAAGDGLNEDDVTLTSMNTNILEIDSDGSITLKNIGKAKIKAVASADDTYAERTVYLTVNVDRHDPYDSAVPFYYAGRPVDSGLDLDISDGPQRLVAPMRPGASVSSFTSDDPGIASIDENGVVTPLASGKTVLRLSFDDGGGKYKTLEDPLLLDITVTGKAPRPDQEASQNTQQDALRKEIAKAKALKRPTLKVKALKGRKIKLTWSKVANADGYIVYVKYPGKKKFVKATTRKAKVKSVTHKGLSKKKVYRYKVRAYKKVNGKTYYSPYSAVKKVRAR